MFHVQVAFLASIVGPKVAAAAAQKAMEVLAGDESDEKPATESSSTGVGLLPCSESAEFGRSALLGRQVWRPKGNANE